MKRSRVYKVVMEITVSDENKQNCDHDGSGDIEFIENELGWCSSSFTDVRIKSVEPK